MTKKNDNMLTQQQIADMRSGMERLRQKLMAEKWPQKYMFKFVMPNEKAKLDSVLEALPQNGDIRFRNSSGDKFVCVTCVATMKSADAVIDVTSKACAVEGVISL